MRQGMQFGGFTEQGDQPKSKQRETIFSTWSFHQAVLQIVFENYLNNERKPD